MSQTKVIAERLKAFVEKPNRTFDQDLFVLLIQRYLEITQQYLDNPN